jgi:hypothetical protein
MCATPIVVYIVYLVYIVCVRYLLYVCVRDFIVCVCIVYIVYIVYIVCVVYTGCLQYCTREINVALMYMVHSLCSKFCVLYLYVLMHTVLRYTVCRWYVVLMYTVHSVCRWCVELFAPLMYMVHRSISSMVQSLFLKRGVLHILLHILLHRDVTHIHYSPSVLAHITTLITAHFNTQGRGPRSHWPPQPHSSLWRL